MQNFLSLFSPRYPTVLTYMLQSTEYQAEPYIKWLHRTRNFNTVMQRRTLDRTKAARLLLLALRFGMLAQIIIGLHFVLAGATNNFGTSFYFGLAIMISYPLVWAYLVTLPLLMGRYFIVAPREQRLIASSRQIFAEHPAVKIAVAGSYGKTTMKELLQTVLGEGKTVAATPGNKNVSVSHAYFAARLTGKEDIVIIEYGEGAPGDVKRFAEITKPTHAVITGLAPAHLDKYKTLEAAGKDIFAVADYLHGKNVHVNGESPGLQDFIKPTFDVFTENTALGWEVSDITIDITETKFTLTKGKKSLKLTSGLIGRHQVGFLAFAAAFALQLGLTEKQVEAGIAKMKPYEHRMQPYQLNGAWIIDDTYNGNLEGIRAGTQLLHDLDAKRKIYVTPGLVEQGGQTRAVHEVMGELIALAQPDLVVLMQNSVTDFIKTGLEKGKYKGELQIETQPLDFYTNLTHFVAHGDLVLMQNDWTDNYA